MAKLTIKGLQAVIEGKNEEIRSLRTAGLISNADLKQAVEKLHRVDFQQDQLSLKIHKALTAIETIKQVNVPGYFNVAANSFPNKDDKLAAEKTPLYNSLFHIGKILFLGE